jgi:hypothetical protein
MAVQDCASYTTASNAGTANTSSTNANTATSPLPNPASTHAPYTITYPTTDTPSHTFYVQL